MASILRKCSLSVTQLHTYLGHLMYAQHWAKEGRLVTLVHAVSLLVIFRVRIPSGPPGISMLILDTDLPLRYSAPLYCHNPL